MKFSWKLLLLLAGLFIWSAASSDLSAQRSDEEVLANLSKEEKKRWKDAARQYRRDLGALKTLVEEHDYYQDQARSLQQQVNDMNAQMSNKDRQITDMQDQMASLNQRVVAAEAAAANAATNNMDTRTGTGSTGMDNTPMVNGIIFRVQIGAFARNQLNDDMATTDNLKLEETGNLQRIIVGQFRQYTNAKQLRDRLRQTGVKDAFIVAYQDGQRIEVDAALKVTGEQK